MSTRRSAARALFGLLLATGLVLSASTGCSSAVHPSPARPASPVPRPGPYPPPRPDSLGGAAPVPAEAPPASASPDQVARAGLAIMYSWYTGSAPDSDTGLASATRRALAYLAPPMSTDVLAAPPVAAPGAQWDSWAAHTAVLTPTITPGTDDTPAATPSTIYRQYEITQTVHSTDGWTTAAHLSTVFVTLGHTPWGWRIAEVTQS